MFAILSINVIAEDDCEDEDNDEYCCGGPDLTIKKYEILTDIDSGIDDSLLEYLRTRLEKDIGPNHIKEILHNKGVSLDGEFKIIGVIRINYVSVISMNYEISDALDYELTDCILVTRIE